MPPAYTSGEAARAAATTRAARRRKPRGFQSGEAARGYATARRAAPQRAAVFRQRYTAPPPKAPRRYSPPATTRSDAASGGRNQLKRADQFKGTRQYYRDYHVAFRANPKVKAASRTIGAGARKAFPRDRARQRVKPTFAQSKAGMALILAGKKAYERETRRGPDKISTPIYDRYAKQLWGRARGQYPGSDKAPRMKVDYGPIGKSNSAWVFHADPGTVHVAPKIPREFMNPKGSRPKSESVLLHEWAHTRQPKGARRPSQPVAEGGAEAVEQLLARKLGLQYRSATPLYERWREQEKRKGRRHVLKGQYK